VAGHRRAVSKFGLMTEAAELAEGEPVITLYDLHHSRAVIKRVARRLGSHPQDVRYIVARGDDADAEFEGEWALTDAVVDYFGTNYPLLVRDRSLNGD